MKRFLLLALAITLLVPGLPVSARAAESNEEQQLIAVLQSDASLTKKDAACARLKRIGTDQSVPALAALLTDEQLSHSARYALESMPSAKAGEVLADALAKTSGLTKIGIINSLGFRGEERAVPALAKLLADQDARRGGGRSHSLGPDRQPRRPSKPCRTRRILQPDRSTMRSWMPGCGARITCWQPAASQRPCPYSRLSMIRRKGTPSAPPPIAE